MRLSINRAADADARPGGTDPLQADGPLQVSGVADPAARLPAVPFEGVHQAGILGAAPPAACFAACDVTARGRPALAELLQTITATARFLTAGGRPPGVPADAPSPDSHRYCAVRAARPR